MRAAAAMEPSGDPLVRPRLRRWVEPMKRITVGLATSVLIAVTAGALLTSARVEAADGDGLNNFFQQLFAPAQPTFSPPPSPQAAPASTSPDGSFGRWQGRRRLDRGDVAHRDRSRAQEAAKKLKTRYASLPKAGLSAEDQKLKAADDRAAELAKAGEIQAALLHDSTLRAGDIVITPEGPKVFVGRERERHRVADFEDVVRSRRIDDKTRRLLVAMVAPPGAITADEARKLAKLRRPELAGQEAVLVTGSTRTSPRVISTALSAPSRAQTGGQAR